MLRIGAYFPGVGVRCAFSVAFAALWSLCPVTTVEAKDRLELRNKYVHLVFDTNTGNLSKFEDLSFARDILEQGKTAELWRLNCISGNRDLSICPKDARLFSFSKDLQHRSIDLTWQGFELPEARHLGVKVSATLEPSTPSVMWKIAIQNDTGLSIKGLSFPRLVPIAPAEKEMLAVPVWMGELLSSPRTALGADSFSYRKEWENPGLLSVQCLALYSQGGPGFLISTDDTKGYLKRFAVFGESGEFGIEIVHLPERMRASGVDFTLPYQIHTLLFKGDWFTAATHYRQWAEKQPWAQESRLSCGMVAPWAQNTDLWLWNRGRSENVLSPAIALSAEAGLSVSVLWHWWHGCAYDVGFPEYFPPREGDESFRAALDRAHAAGVHTIVYMNQRLWGMTTKSWQDEGAATYAVKGFDGTVRPEIYNVFTQAPCASMCMGTTFWRNKYASLAEKAILQFGVDGIYMDQACSNLACYDPNHGHPIGGGTYWIQGFRMLEQDIRNRCRRAAPITLAGEGCGESWLPHLDLMLSLQVSRERYAAPSAWEPIPFFHAVYHQYGLLFGNYSSLVMPPYDELWPPEFAPTEPQQLLDKTYSQQFRLEQARAFVWGQQPTLANFRPELLRTRPEELDFLFRIVRLRRYGLKYFRNGSMLRPPELDTPTQEIDISRLSIYAGRREALTHYRKTCPSVLSGAWLAPDGDVCVVFVNVSPQEQRFSVRLPRKEYFLNHKHVMRVVEAEGRWEEHPIKTSPSDIVLTVSLFPYDVRLYEFCSEKRADMRYDVGFSSPFAQD